MDRVTAQFPKSWPLETLEIALQQGEGIFGALQKISSVNAGNKAMFDVGPTPVHRVTIATFADDAPPAKEGHDVVSHANLWIEDVKKKVVAYRKRP